MAIPALLLEFVVLKGLGWVLVKTRLKAQPPGIMQQVTRAPRVHAARALPGTTIPIDTGGVGF